MTKLKIYISLMLGIFSANLWGASYFVTPSGEGSKSGSSWTTAMGTAEFSLKLVTALSGDIFYLSEGTYSPQLDNTGSTPADQGKKTFRLRPGVQLVGSYKSGLSGSVHAETDRKLKDSMGELCPSTIFNGNGTVYVLIDAQNRILSSTSAVVLNGIAITGSQKATILSEKSGLELVSCKITENLVSSGGAYVGSVEGAVIHQVEGSCTIQNSDISGNDMDGAGMNTSAPVWVENGTLEIINSLISDNTLTGNGTPAILIENSTGNIVNSTISGNEADNPGLGAVTVRENSTMSIISSTLTDNTAGVSLLFEGDSNSSNGRLKLDNTLVSGNDKDLALYGIGDFGTTVPNTNITTPNGILGKVSAGGDVPEYTIVGSDLFNGSTTGTGVGFDALTDLGDLEYNGGDTKTHKLLDIANNPAFQEGNPDYAGNSGRTDGLEKDQRGETRLSPPCIGAYDGIDKVKLQLTLFLEGLMIGTKTMSNYLQTHDAVYSYYDQTPYPVNDPYGLGTTYSQYSNVSGPAGKIVDWIKVEIWSSVNMGNYTRTVSQSKALLLRPDGTVVDENGQIPSFNPISGPVRIVVKHRCHLAVMSKEISSFTGNITYDFSSALTQAPKIELATDPDFLVLKNGVYCLRAGDVNKDGYVDSTDRTSSYNDYKNNEYDKYINTDINMDGYVDSTDYTIVINAYSQSLYSALFYFE